MEEPFIVKLITPTGNNSSIMGFISYERLAEILTERDNRREIERICRLEICKDGIGLYYEDVPKTN